MSLHPPSRGSITEPSAWKRARSWDLILTVVGVAAAASIFAASLYLSGSVNSALDKIQRESSVARVASVLQALDQNTRHLIDYTAGYAMWDDAYRFMENHDAAFLQTNYAESVLAATPVQLVAIYSLNGDLLFSAALDEQSKTEPVPGEIRHLPKFELFAMLKKPNDSLGRIEWIGRRAYLIAICPITDSAGTAPIRGYLVFGTIVGEKMLDRMHTLTGTKVSVEGDGVAARGNFLISTVDLGPAEVSIQESGGLADSKARAVFREDNSEQRSVLFQMKLPAEASQTGRQLSRTISAVFLLVAAGFALFVALSIREIRFRRAELRHRLVERDELQAATKTAEILADKAAAADRAKSVFLAMISHEIRTPLNAIIGYADLLKQDPGESLQERLGIIATSGAVLQHILNDILDFSKIEAGKLQINTRPTQVRRMIEEVVATFRNLAQAKGNPIDIVVDPAVPEYLMLDDLRVKQILSNLMSNAVKFTDGGSIRVAVQAHSAEPGDAAVSSFFPDPYTLSISVEDEGIGVAEKEETSLFEPFSQADSTVARRYEGTGLGLVICRRLCTLMGGRISFQRRPVKGSIFSVSLPARLVAESDGISPAAHSTFEVHDDDLSILIVDDNVINARLLQAILKRLGRSAEIALSGEAAVEYFQRTPPDVIFMDIHMPGMDGMEAARCIRTLETESDRPPCVIIAVTADTLIAGGSQSLAAGMNGHLNKPIHAEEIGEIISQISERKPR